MIAIGLVFAAALAAPPGPPPPDPEYLAANLPAFSWCAGALTAELDHWGDGSGIHSVLGWSYRYYNAHAAVLRIDGVSLYSTNQAPGAQRFGEILVDAAPASATGRIVHRVPGVAEVTTWLRGADVDGCCLMRVTTEVRNLDRFPHTFEWRWFHDTAYKVYQRCPVPRDPDVDGGEVCLPGQVPGKDCRTGEFDALAAGAVGCGKSLSFYSADSGLIGPVYVFDERNPPHDLEVIVWKQEALDPQSFWSRLVGQAPIDGCTGDNAILAIWKLPASGVALAPGEAASLSYSIGQGCVPACCAMTADPGPPQLICEGRRTTIGGVPVAVGGRAPFYYRWSPEDSEISDPTAERPVVWPSQGRTYTVEVLDSGGCQARASVRVDLEPDAWPGSVGNTLRALKSGGRVVCYWGSATGAATFLVLGDTDKRFLAPRRDLENLLATSGVLPRCAEEVRFLRVHGVSCGGREGM